jgi:hypothetical protein
VYSFQEDYLNRKNIFMKILLYRPILKITTLVSFLFLVLIQFGCSKEVAVSDLDFQRHLVGGTGNFQNTFKIWKLDSISVDGKSLALTANQKKYTKKFYHSGAYIDSDGFAGTWELGEINALKHITTGITSTVKLTSSYEIIEVNSAQLNLKLLNTTPKYEYFFIIAN